MTRLATLLHRKPRTRRERLLLRLQPVRDAARTRWDHVRRYRRRRADRARVEALFLQLGRKPHHHADRPDGRAPHMRLHLLHPRR